MAPVPLRMPRPAAAVAAALVLGLVTTASAAGSNPARPLPQTEIATLAGIANGYLQQRADTVTTAGRTHAVRHIPANVTPALRGKLHKEFTQLARQGREYERTDGGYTHAKVNVVPHTAVWKRDMATLLITEKTSLYFPEPRPGEPDAEGYAMGHKLTFTRSQAGEHGKGKGKGHRRARAKARVWLLAADKPDLGSDGPSTYLAR